MLFNEKTEENLQCGFSGTPKGGFGGGGGSAASSKKASPAAESTGTHDDIPNVQEDAQGARQKLQELTGLSESDVRETMKAVMGYTQERSADIRDFQYGSTKDMSPKDIERAKREVEVLNKYIDKMPKFKGDIYRGKDFESPEKAEAFLNKLKTSDYQLPALSSFSSTPKIADNFARSRSKMGMKGRVPIVFVVEGNKSGASIRSLSEKTKEDEVLVPKNVRYRLKKAAYQKDGIWYVPLAES